MTAESPADPPRPVLRVVSGNPDPEHVAALVAVFSVMGGAVEAELRASAWARSARAARRFPRPGADAWRLSLRR
ncbi:MAG: acyl-CoA carboxylase subunit epsilon [Candidatus Nanopelagicales bacterium]